MFQQSCSADTINWPSGAKRPNTGIQPRASNAIDNHDQCHLVRLFVRESSEDLCLNLVWIESLIREDKGLSRTFNSSKKMLSSTKGFLARVQFKAQMGNRVKIWMMTPGASMNKPKTIGEKKMQANANPPRRMAYCLPQALARKVSIKFDDQAVDTCTLTWTALRTAV